MSDKTNTPREKQFFSAIKNGQVDTVRSMVVETPKLLEAFDYESFGGTPLNIVVFKEDVEMIGVLLDLGADPDRKSDWWAGPWNAMQSALNSGNDKLAEYLVTRGATVGVHEAAGLGRVADLKAILDASPEKIHERGGDGCTPLHFAGSAEVADLLIERGADWDARDVDHYSTPAQYLAKDRPEVARHLFQIGATPDIFSAVLANDGAVVKRLIAEDRSLLEARINQETFPPSSEHDVHNVMTFTVGMNATPLHAAANAERIEMLDVLLAEGVDVNIRGGYDDAAAMHVAAWNDSLAVAKKLVAGGADINLRSGAIHNNTPAGWCIVAGSADVFCYLLDEGAEVLDTFHDAAQAGVDGKFRQYKASPPENAARILTRLS